jgi:hypothetical protein
MNADARVVEMAAATTTQSGPSSSYASMHYVHTNAYASIHPYIRAFIHIQAYITALLHAYVVIGFGQYMMHRNYWPEEI